MRDAPWLLYGANGVTGRLALAEALRRGHRPILAGRDASVHALGEQHSLETACLALDDRPALEALLGRVSRVVHIAGPYSRTAAPMVEACLATDTPYVDIDGELESIGATLGYDARARARGTALVAGAGFGVAAGESLAMHLATKVPHARSLLLGIQADNAHASRGAAASRLDVIGRGGAWIEGGRLVPGPLAHRAFRGAVGGRRYTFVAAPLADALAAHRSTGIPEVIAGVPLPAMLGPVLRWTAPLLRLLLRRPRVRRFLEQRTRRAPAGAEEGPHRSFVWAQATGDEGTSTAVLSLGEGYAFAAAAAVRAAERLSSLEGGGAMTPGAAFGPGFVMGLEGVERQDLAPEAS